MATPADARAVKSLNTSGGRKRFVYKNLGQRINEIDIIGVFRGLEKVKPEPSEGSSFLRDCLVEWRELNTAEDFISFYEEMLPFVQTLPLVIEQKELIFTKLVSRLKMNARLSLEAILRLIAALSRDLLEDFIPFLPRIVNSLLTLLENGAQKDPDIVKQIFFSWCEILMYLQKYLVRNIEGILRDTLELRYHPKDYISELMSESMSFLLRNARNEQLEKGINRILSEAADPHKKAGAVDLLYYAMRGTYGSLHSKAERVLSFLLKSSTLSFCDNSPQGPGTVVEVVSSTLERLCEDLEAEKLSVMWECLNQEINESIKNKNSVHLSRLLNVLTAVVRIQKGLKVHDYPSLIRLVSLIVSTFVASSETVVEGDNLSAVLDEVLQLMLCTINRVNEMETVASQWAPIFALKSSSLLTFLGELLNKDQSVVKAFTNNILSAINNMIWESSEEVIPLLLTFCENQQTSHDRVNIVDQTFERIHEFLEENIKKVRQNIENTGLSQIDNAELAAIWGVVNCYPYFKVDSSLLISFKETLRQHFSVSDVNTSSAQELMWQSLLGSALRSCHKLPKSVNHRDLEEALSFAKDYKSCVQVLSPVADFLDLTHRLALANDDRFKAYPELQEKRAKDAFGIFSENLRHPNKRIRLMTLKILCHFETFSSDSSFEEHPPKKKMKTEEIKKPLRKRNVLELLRSVEEIAPTVNTEGELSGMISEIQRDLSAGRIHTAYVQLVLNGMMGLFHISYNKFWGPASECLAVLLRNHTVAVWSDFVCYLDQCQQKFETLHNHCENANQSLSERPTDLIGRFNSFLFPPSNSTPTEAVVTQLLQTLQKVPTVAQSRASDILPLLLKFLGYNIENPMSVGLFNAQVCKGEEWTKVLKQWLTLLKLMKNPKSFRFSQFLNNVLQNRFLDDNDAEVQTIVLECLLLSNDFLLPHREHLLKLIKPEELREELTTWNLSEDIEEAHRSHIFSLEIRILAPKVRTLKNLASRKHTSISHRKAVLRFIAQRDVDDLALFFALLIKPLNIISEETMDVFWSSGKSSLDYFQKSNFLKDFTGDAISTLSRNQKSGFLHVIQDILEVFDEIRVRPFLDFLMGCVVRLMVKYPNINEERNTESLPIRNDTAAPATPDNKDNDSVNHDQAGTALKQFKELRSLCLKIIAHVLDKYEDSDLGSEFWDLFFSAVNPLIKNFKQEGSSSEKPSSLFSCFLSMSRNHNLATLLCREESLVPDICSILTVTTASEAIKSSALKFIENLLCLENELDEDDNMIKGFLDPYIETLFNSLHFLFIGDIKKRKSVKYHGEREIKILKLLSKHIGDNQSCAMKYLDVLLSFLDTSVKDSDIRREALLAIQDMISLLGTESTTKIINKVSPLLVDAEVDVRLCICDLLESLAKIDNSLDDVAKRIRDMNAISPMEVDDLDYEKIVNAYVEIDSNFFNKSSKQHTMIILSQSLYNLSSESIMLRGSAHELLSSFIDFSASILCQEASAHSGFGKEVKIADASWTGSRILFIVDFILKHIADAISRGGVIIKEWILLIREMVTKLPDAANLGAFRPLCSEDENKDFFKSIIHIQVQRRQKAVIRFAKVVVDSSLPEGVVRKVLVSVFFKMMLDGQDGKDNNVGKECPEALASVSAHMSWKSYYALLNLCFREMNKHTKKGKLLLRLICLILDKFHFREEDGYRQEEVEEIQNCLKTVFRKMQKLMDSDSDNVNVHSNVAALKVLKLLPKDVMHDFLSPIIKKIATFLKNRMESIREDARSALVACLKELGLEYLQVVIKSLRDILKRGSELHVLGFTVNFILSKCLSNPTCGKLDHCLDDLLAVVEINIFGEVAEQKDVAKFKNKMKETKEGMSFETLKLIAENVTFREQALKLLSPVTAQLRRHLTPTIKIAVEKMLKHIAAGIEGNPSVDQVDLFVFIYGRVDDGINNRDGLGDQETSPPSKKKGKSRDRQETAGLISGARSCPHLITVFALELFHNRMKKINLDKTNKELLGKLDSFVKLLTGCLRSKYEDIVSSALRCFTSLIRFPLPSLISESDEVKTTLLTIAQSVVNSSSPLVEPCLKLLTMLLGNKDITLSSEQLKLVIQFPMFVDLESNPSSVATNALSLLKAIVKRKLVVPEIYDVAVQVSELLVKSQNESIRKNCEQILSIFLVHYTLSEKRLEQHMNSLLQSLSYEHPTGREAVLDMLQSLISKFSVPNHGKKSFLDQHSTQMLIQLAHCLGNDNNQKVLSRIGSVIELLIGRISEDQVGSILSYCMCWYKQQNLRAVAAQVLGFIIDSMKKKFRKHIYNTLQDAKAILESAVSASSLQFQDTVEEVVPFWKEAYYSLIMIEKMIGQFPDVKFKKDLEDIWKMVFKFLLHPHVWLRSISCRLLNCYFKALAGRKRAESQIVVADSLLESPSSLFLVAVSLCSQLKDEPTAGNVNVDLLTENIAFAVLSLHSLIGQSDQANHNGFWSSLGEDEQVVFLKAFEVLDSGKGRSTFLALTSGAGTDNGVEDDADAVRNVLIGSLLKRMGKIALDMESVQMRIVFNVYKAFTSQMNQEECRLYAYKILLPLYKVCEGFTGKIISDECKQLAEEVRDCIRDKTLGNQIFVEVYNEIRKSLRTKREKRKREEKLMAVVNPERNAKRKLRLASKNKANKRRRMTSMKLSRWARS